MEEEELDKEIQKALTEEESALQIPIDKSKSPLAKSVKTGDIANVNDKEVLQGDDLFETAQRQYKKTKTDQAILDAPEQHIGNEQADTDTATQEENAIPQGATISNTQATQTAQALLGMADNLLGVGGGYFVKIKKHEEFFEFEELIEVVDTQNEKNVNRIQLDDQDKALLTPLLAQVIQNKTKQLTPEQQLLGAIISVIVKKAQAVMEIRSENKSLESRILQIVRDSKEESLPQEPTVSSESTIEDDSLVDNKDQIIEDETVNPYQEEVLRYNAQEVVNTKELLPIDIVYEEVEIPTLKKNTPSQRVKKQHQKRVKNHKNAKQTDALSENDDSS